MMDASGTGAKLTLAQSVEGLRLKEFFSASINDRVIISCCELAWVNGDDMGVRFIEKPESSKPKERKESN